MNDQLRRLMGVPAESRGPAVAAVPARLAKPMPLSPAVAAEPAKSATPVAGLDEASPAYQALKRQLDELTRLLAATRTGQLSPPTALPGLETASHIQEEGYARLPGVGAADVNNPGSNPGLGADPSLGGMASAAQPPPDVKGPNLRKLSENIHRYGPERFAVNQKSDV